MSTIESHDLRTPLWEAVKGLIDRSPSLQDLRAHRLHLLAAAHWQAAGRHVPPELGMDELIAVQLSAATRAIVETARDACGQPILVLKGPSVAARYPVPHLRPTGDLDLLVQDAPAAQAALVRAGFEPVGPFPDRYYDGLHHLRPLALPGVVGPIVELHRRPNWVHWRRPPTARELLTGATEGRMAITGVLELAPAVNAVVLAAHSWGELPLRRLGDLVDIAALMAEAEGHEATDVAARWGLERLWRTTSRVTDAVLGGAGPPVPLRTWGRNLPEARDCMVYEMHLRRWLGPFWATNPRHAVRLAGREIANDVLPAPGETLRNKLHRGREALLHPKRPSTEHKALLGPEGVQPRHVRFED